MNEHLICAYYELTFFLAIASGFKIKFHFLTNSNFYDFKRMKLNEKTRKSLFYFNMGISISFSLCFNTTCCICTHTGVAKSSYFVIHKRPQLMK